MAKLIYMMNTSLDGYTEDEHGGFGWTAPQDEEVHTWIFAHVSSFRTCLYGRRVYETMLYWETAHTLPDQRRFVLDFARQWQAAEKITDLVTRCGGTRDGAGHSPGMPHTFQRLDPTRYWRVYN